MLSFTSSHYERKLKWPPRASPDPLVWVRGVSQYLLLLLEAEHFTMIKCGWDFFFSTHFLSFANVIIVP